MNLPTNPFKPIKYDKTVHVTRFAHDLQQQNNRFRVKLQKQASDLKQASKIISRQYKNINNLEHKIKVLKSFVESM